MDRRTSLSVLALLATLSLAVAAADNKPVGQRVSVTIDNMAYSPSTVRAKVGDTVTWNNRDDHDHTVAADDGSFRSGNLRSGSSFSHTFKKPGTYAYGCKYHPRMRGTVVVAE